MLYTIKYRTEANYKHYFRKEITLFTITFILVPAKRKKKMQIIRMLYRTCCTEQFVQVINSLILLHKFYIKLFLKKSKLYGHFLVTIKRKFEFSSYIHVYKVKKDSVFVTSYIKSIRS